MEVAQMLRNAPLVSIFSLLFCSNIFLMNKFYNFQNVHISNFKSRELLWIKLMKINEKKIMMIRGA